MATPIQKQYISSVSLLQEKCSTSIIPNGEIWEVQSWFGSANPGKDTHVCLVWDYDGAGEEIVAITYTSEKRNIDRQFEGNGVKKLAIVLVNDTLDTER